MEYRDLSRLLLLLYEGVSTPQRMQAFMEGLAQTVQAKGAVLREHEYSSHGGFQVDTANLLATYGYSTEALLHYRKIWKKDVYLKRCLEHFAEADCGVSQTLIPYAELQRTEMYAEYQKPFDIGPMMWVRLSEERGQHSSISLVRQDGGEFFSEENMCFLQALAPHLRQAFRLNRTLQEMQISNAVLSHATQGEAPIAICLIRQDGTVLNTTEDAEKILSCHDGIWLEKGRLQVANSYEQTVLEALTATATQTGANGGTGYLNRQTAQAAGQQYITSWTSGAGGTLLVSRTPPRGPLQLLITPFCPGTLLNEPQATALVRISDPNAAPRSRAAILKALYKLTPTEARIADLLLQGLETREISHKVGNTLESVRFNIKQIFAKTGTNRQAQLVRLMLGLISSEPGSAH